MSTPDQLTPAELKEILKKSGYLFEQKAASIIESLDFHTTTNKSYKDSDEGKSREIDISAFKEVFHIEKFNTRGVCYLTCECKNSNNPFVFFTRRKNKIDEWYSPKEVKLVYDSYLKKKDQLASVQLNGFTYMGLDKHFFYCQTDIKAVQFCKIVRSKDKFEAQNSGIVEPLLYPLIKAYRDFEPLTPNSSDSKKYCKIFFNLVIVNSDLYTIDTENEDALPEKKDYVPFLWDIRSENIEGSFLVTFVTFNNLEEFINTKILDFCKQIEKAYNSDDKFLLSPSLADIF